jgi:Zn finger protein HypA/HybF involved in hydrogenase expression
MMPSSSVARHGGTVHEHDLVAGVIETVRILAGDNDLEEVEIAVGPSVDPARAAKEWSLLTSDTPLEYVRVTWEQRLELFRCDDCGHEFSGSVAESLCPYCGVDGVMIESAAPISLVHWVVSSTTPAGLVDRADLLHAGRLSAR